MTSVTVRISQVKQPRGGYLPPKIFTEISLKDRTTLNEKENIHSSLVGLCVDYLTRYIMGSSAEESFRISLAGALSIGKGLMSNFLISNIKGLDDYSIICACKLVGYDVCARSSIMGYKPVEDINADSATLENIRTMVKRCISFWDIYGPIILEGFTFGSGYTPLVTSGDGDYLTKDTLWDLKVSKNKISNKHTLQLLVYYMLGLRSTYKEFQHIENLGIFNPRLNILNTLNILDIDRNIFDAVSRDVLGVT